MMRSCYPNDAPPPFLENASRRPSAPLHPILFHRRSKEPAMAMPRLSHERLMPSRPHGAHEDSREDCREVSSLYSSSLGVLIVEAAIVFVPIVQFFFPRHAILTVTGSDTSASTILYYLVAKVTRFSSSGNEKFKCTEDPDCLWGGSTEDGLAHHRRKYHGGKVARNGDGIPSGTPYESEPTVDPSPSSALSPHDNSLVDGTKTLTDKPIVSPEAPFDGQAQVVTRDEDVEYFWTSPRTGFKHGDPCYSPEAKQLFPAASAGPLDEGHGDIPSLGGALNGVDTGQVPFVNTSPLGLMEDAMAAMNAVNMLVPIEAPSHHPGTARTLEWCNGQSDVDRLEALEKDFCLLDVAIVEGFLGGRTRICQWRIVIFRRAVTMDLQTKRDVGCLHGLT
ncbi:hypothetical protein ARMGADRAFT_1079958 [Armillaria gallica]|uniref:Uncharacterized protein n=1 Tax=Armillaria gallica TaxID=47427 RepID=A0A2H3E1T7_ARMGA|nr:hypothetical protein ARMGADRAFT_1079958 [Armillaria gallica]